MIFFVCYHQRSNIHDISLHTITLTNSLLLTQGANILVDNTGLVKLADFGASRKIEDIATIESGFKSVKGTPYWMAPEVITQSGYGRQADIWSVGCTIIEMATGKPPWSQYGSQVSAMFNIAKSKGPPTIPEHLSADCKDFLYLCFNRKPHERPPASTLLKHPFLEGVVCRTVAAPLNNIAEVGVLGAEAEDADGQQIPAWRMRGTTTASPMQQQQSQQQQASSPSKPSPAATIPEKSGMSPLGNHLVSSSSGAVHHHGGARRQLDLSSAAGSIDGNVGTARKRDVRASNPAVAVEKDTNERPSMDAFDASCSSDLSNNNHTTEVPSLAPTVVVSSNTTFTTTTTSSLASGVVVNSAQKKGAAPSRSASPSASSASDDADGSRRSHKSSSRGAALTVNVVSHNSDVFNPMEEPAWNHYHHHHSRSGSARSTGSDDRRRPDATRRASSASTPADQATTPSEEATSIQPARRPSSRGSGATEVLAPEVLMPPPPPLSAAEQELRRSGSLQLRSSGSMTTKRQNSTGAAPARTSSSSLASSSLESLSSVRSGSRAATASEGPIVYTVEAEGNGGGMQSLPWDVINEDLPAASGSYSTSTRSTPRRRAEYPGINSDRGTSGDQEAMLLSALHQRAQHDLRASMAVFSKASRSTKTSSGSSFLSSTSSSGGMASGSDHHRTSCRATHINPGIAVPPPRSATKHTASGGRNDGATSPLRSARKPSRIPRVAADSPARQQRYSNVSTSSSLPPHTRPTSTAVAPPSSASSLQTPRKSARLSTVAAATPTPKKRQLNSGSYEEQLRRQREARLSTPGRGYYGAGGGSGHSSPVKSVGHYSLRTPRKEVMGGEPSGTVRRTPARRASAV